MLEDSEQQTTEQHVNSHSTALGTSNATSSHRPQCAHIAPSYRVFTTAAERDMFCKIAQDGVLDGGFKSHNFLVYLRSASLKRRPWLLYYPVPHLWPNVICTKIKWFVRAGFERLKCWYELLDAMQLAHARKKLRMCKTCPAIGFNYPRMSSVMSDGWGSHMCEPAYHLCYRCYLTYPYNTGWGSEGASGTALHGWGSRDTRYERNRKSLMEHKRKESCAECSTNLTNLPDNAYLTNKDYNPT